MKISGLQKLTLLDYPEHLAAIVFLGGCNFRCPFCQNSSLVLSSDTLPVISMEEFRSFLRKRSGILDGICVTGGEPTLHADLPAFLSEIHNAGYLVKLDTNGTNPDMLQLLLEQKLVDYVAMDIKAGRDNYARVCGLTDFKLTNSEFGYIDSPSKIMDSTYEFTNSSSSFADSPSEVTDSTYEFTNSSSSFADSPSGTPDLQSNSELAFAGSASSVLQKIDCSMQLLKSSPIPYELRTTIVRGLHTAADFEDIADWLTPLSGQGHYYLQSFRDCPEILQKEHCFSAFSDLEMQEFLRIIQRSIPTAVLRGSDMI